MLNDKLINKGIFIGTNKTEGTLKFITDHDKYVGKNMITIGVVGKGKAYTIK